MAKIMILGGGKNQLPLIEAAKKRGHVVVLCDLAVDNPGRRIADMFFRVSTLDLDDVLETAAKNQIDGITSNSEPAMRIVAHTAARLGLPGNPPEAIETLCRKDRFRQWQTDNGFEAPRFAVLENKNNVFKQIENLRFPMMIKPVDSSGSRGVKKVSEITEVNAATLEAMRYSRASRAIAEEYVVNSLSNMVGGDVFVSGGKVILAGLMSAIRNESINPFVPCGEAYPANVRPELKKLIISEISRLVDTLGIRFGPINVEIMINSEQRPFFVEMNPRNGGNLIPASIKLNLGFDIFDATIQVALGEEVEHTSQTGVAFATYVLHSIKSGTLRAILFSNVIQEYIQEYHPIKKIGDSVEEFVNADKLIGILFLQFPDNDRMYHIMSRMNDFITLDIVE